MLRNMKWNYLILIMEDTQPVFSIIHPPPFLTAYEDYVARPPPMFKEKLED